MVKYKPRTKLKHKLNPALEVSTHPIGTSFFFCACPPSAYIFAARLVPPYGTTRNYVLLTVAYLERIRKTPFRLFTFEKFASDVGGKSAPVFFS